MEKNPHAQALGKLRMEKATADERKAFAAAGGTASAKAKTKSERIELSSKAGIKGGPARAKSLTPERRREIAQKAAAKRWGKA